MFTHDEMQQKIKAADAAKLQKIYQIREKLQPLFLRALRKPGGANFDDPNSAQDRARSLLEINGLDPEDFKVMPTVERSAEEMLAEFRAIKSGQTNSPARGELETQIKELRSELIKKMTVINNKAVKIDTLKAEVRNLQKLLAKAEQKSVKTIQSLTASSKPEEPPVLVVTDKPPSKKKSKADGGELGTPAPYQEACHLHIDLGMSATKTAKEMGLLDEAGVPRPGPIDNRITNSGPDEKLLGREIVIQQSGPMSFYEFWKIAYFLFPGTNWRRSITKEFGLANRSIGTNPPSKFFTQTQMDMLRDLYWDRQESCRRVIRAA